MMEQTKGQLLLGTTPLKARGWTPALVKRFLDPPDATRTNPMYRSAPPMRLYDLSRVEAVEATDDWRTASALAAERSHAGKAVAARKSAELVEQAGQLPITVRLLSPEEVRRQAIASYNAFHADMLYERGHDYEPASDRSDTAFLERITVNFIRHELTGYDRRLEEVAGKIGVHAATATIRSRVYAQIARVYPDLAEECRRQIAARTMVEPCIIINHRV